MSIKLSSLLLLIFASTFVWVAPTTTASPLRHYCFDTEQTLCGEVVPDNHYDRYKDALLYKARGEALLAEHKPAAAIVEYNKAILIYMALAGGSEIGDMLSGVAKAKYDLHDRDGAWSYAVASIEHASNVRALDLMGDIENERGHHYQALFYWNKAYQRSDYDAVIAAKLKAAGIPDPNNPPDEMVKGDRE